MLRTEEINCLHSQSGNFVVMSVETLDKICAKNNDYKPITTIPIKTFLAYYIDKLGLYDDISFLDLHGSEITVGVDEAFSVGTGGELFSTPIIGLDSTVHRRFLENGEKTLAEFAKEHRMFAPDLDKDSEAYETIIREYRDYVLKRVTRHNPVLDQALGISGFYKPWRAGDV